MNFSLMYNLNIMNRNYIIIFKVCLLMNLFSSAVLSDVKDDLEKIMNECEKKDIFSGTVVTYTDGNIIYERSIGLSDREKNIQNENDTKHNIASIGKLFTAVMILQLAQEGKLDLESKISFFVKDASDKVTVRHLLQHTSGYGDYLNDPEFSVNPVKYKNIKDLTELILKEPLKFEAGEKFSYSNSGYVLLGGVIEFVTGKSYSENLTERILDPLGMKNSEYEYKEPGDLKRAVGYIKDITGKFSDNREFPEVPTPAGGMYSTAHDLYIFGRSLLENNILLNDDSKLSFFTEFSSESKVDLQQIFSDPDGGNVYAGGSPGINSMLMIFPQKKTVTVILSNYDQAAINLEKNITDLILKGELNLPKPNIAEYIYSVISGKGIEYADENFKSLMSENGYVIKNDMLLNQTGYRFLKSGLTDESIMIFKKNAEMFPDVANCFDSLGEAYLIKGDKVNAAANFKKALEMDPGNENAKNILNKLN
ncbi:MAG: serine hydrolase [Ignavibacteria bacterium]|nr:serine hydrolase [Ignavibacteria bacterium]